MRDLFYKSLLACICQNLILNVEDIMFQFQNFHTVLGFEARFARESITLTIGSVYARLAWPIHPRGEASMWVVSNNMRESFLFQEKIPSNIMAINEHKGSFDLGNESYYYVTNLP